MRAWQVVIPVLLLAGSASAQQAVKTQNLPSINMQDSKGIGSNPAKGGNEAAAAGDSTIAELLSRGYQIKTAVPNGAKFVVFMQKDQSAYACEFSSLTNTRCGSLN
ncbi:hypothetical protein HGP17_02520 [Rhizobium sp. P38BS-XIX]|uniref:hypothetical protein n=1 Tax=Rhizobium sp. P38BS-XIX TaxID=2726740 RepID=UPI001456FCA3|nr:hypothetical protein [Rhizobium sp. P38BS-XIX]NLR95707.1 hypothetical protein [Rhizobium sp. P38BS-XIX]